MAISINSRKQIRGNYYVNKTEENNNKIRANKFLNKINITNPFNNFAYKRYLINTNIFKASYGIVTALFIFSLICFALYRSYNYATNSNYFQINLIEFSNNKILSNEELLTITNLELGSNILNHNINEIKFKLLENNWIENVTINRDLPDKFYIDVQEKKPFFIGIHDENIYYLDKNLNIIDNVNKEKFISLPTFHVNSYNEDAINKIGLFIDTLNNANMPFAIDEISWFSINSLYGYEFYIENINLQINVTINNFEQAIQNLTLALHDLKKRNEINKVNNIIALSDQVIVEKN